MKPILLYNQPIKEENRKFELIKIFNYNNKTWTINNLKYQEKEHWFSICMKDEQVRLFSKKSQTVAF